MSLNFFRSSILVNVIFFLSIISIFAVKASANGDISEEKLNTERGLKWGGEGLPFDDILTIREPLVNSIIGKVTIDRHGEDNGPEEHTGIMSIFNSLAIRNPFAGPNPGRMTIVTLWGSKEEGCFVKALIHSAPKSDGDAQNFVPAKMEVGVGSQVIKLTPTPQSSPKAASSNYTYTEYANNTNITKTASMYFAENTFAINGKVADLLRNAPKGNARVRITFANGDTKIFPIGEKNVARWRDTYGYNPNCSNGK